MTRFLRDTAAMDLPGPSRIVADQRYVIIGRSISSKLADYLDARNRIQTREPIQEGQTAAEYIAERDEQRRQAQDAQDALLIAIEQLNNMNI